MTMLTDNEMHAARAAIAEALGGTVESGGHAWNDSILLHGEDEGLRILLTIQAYRGAKQGHGEATLMAILPKTKDNTGDKQIGKSVGLNVMGRDPEDVARDLRRRLDIERGRVTQAEMLAKRMADIERERQVERDVKERARAVPGLTFSPIYGNGPDWRWAYNPTGSPIYANGTIDHKSGHVAVQYLGGLQGGAADVVALVEALAAMAKKAG